MTTDGMDGRYLILEIQTTQPALLWASSVSDIHCWTMTRNSSASPSPLRSSKHHPAALGGGAMALANSAVCRPGWFFFFSLLIGHQKGNFDILITL